jgi:hypothetical protein
MKYAISISLDRRIELLSENISNLFKNGWAPEPVWTT